MNKYIITSLLAMAMCGIAFAGTGSDGFYHYIIGGGNLIGDDSGNFRVEFPNQPRRFAVGHFNMFGRFVTSWWFYDSLTGYHEGTGTKALGRALP